MERRGNMRAVEPEEVRVPPHDLRAERSVIGAILTNSSAFGRVQEIIEVEDFYSETNRVVYRAALNLAGRGDPVDQITITNELRSVDEFDRVGGRAYIFELIEGVPVSVNAHRYAQIVRDKSVLRNLIDAGSRIAEDAFRGSANVSEAVEAAEHIVYEISSEGSSRSAGQGGASPLGNLATEALEDIQARFEGGESPGLRTGFPDLDRMTTGMHPGELVILAARPAMGKTSMALNMIEAAAKQEGSAALIFTLEMSKEQLTKRIISHFSGIPVTALNDGTQMRQEDFPRLLRAVGEAGELPVYIEDTASLAISQIRSKIRRESARLKAQGQRLNLVVVDYLQLMVGDRTRNSESRQIEVGDISRGLKVIARDFNVPVVALAQLSRAVEQRGDKRPMLSDLRDSGSIEQDADKVLFLYRDEYYDESTEDRGIAEVIVSKHRNGPTGKVRLAWAERTAQFRSLAREST